MLYDSHKITLSPIGENHLLFARQIKLTLSSVRNTTCMYCTQQAYNTTCDKAPDWHLALKIRYEELLNVT